MDANKEQEPIDPCSILDYLIESEGKSFGNPRENPLKG
jgi:hypothetical protein